MSEDPGRMIDETQAREMLHGAVASPPAGLADDLACLVTDGLAIDPGGGASADLVAAVVPIAVDSDVVGAAPVRARRGTPLVIGVAAAATVALLAAVAVGGRPSPNPTPGSTVTTYGSAPIPSTSATASPATPTSPRSTSTSTEPAFGGPPEGCTDTPAPDRARPSVDGPPIGTFRSCDVGFSTFAVDRSGVWGASTGADGASPALVHLDAALGVLARYPLPHAPLAIASADAVVWLVSDGGDGLHLVGILASDGHVTTDVAMREEPSLADGMVPPVRVAVGRSSRPPGTTGLWVSVGRTTTVHWFNPVGGEETLVASPTVPVDLATHGSYAAVIGADGIVAELSPHLDPYVLGTVPGPGVAIAADGGRLWAAGSELVEFDEGLRAMVGRIPGTARSLAFDPMHQRRLWAAPFEPDPAQIPGIGAGAIVAFDGLIPEVQTYFQTVANSGVGHLVVGATGVVFGLNDYSGLVSRLLLAGTRDPGVVAGPAAWPAIGAVTRIGDGAPTAEEAVAFDDRSGGELCVGIRDGDKAVLDGCSADEQWTAVEPSTTATGLTDSFYVIGRRSSADEIRIVTDHGDVLVRPLADKYAHFAFAVVVPASTNVLSISGATGYGATPCTYRDIVGASPSTRFEFHAQAPVSVTSCDGKDLRLTMLKTSQDPYVGHAELEHVDGYWSLRTSGETP